MSVMTGDVVGRAPGLASRKNSPGIGSVTTAYQPAEGEEGLFKHLNYSNLFKKILKKYKQMFDKRLNITSGLK